MQQLVFCHSVAPCCYSYQQTNANVPNTLHGKMALHSSVHSCKTLLCALCRFTAFLDVDHGKQGIRTFAIHPGGVKTGEVPT